MNAMANIPAHVPPELVRDYDYADMMGETDVYAHLRKLHNEPDLFYTPHYEGHWVASRFADMEHIYNHPEDFSSKHETIPKNPFVLPLLEFDGRIHIDFRVALSPFFTPRSITNLEHMARELTVSLIDGFYARGECDFVAEFSQRMPIMIMMRLMGLPEEDTPHLVALAEDIVRSLNVERQMAAFGKVREYVLQRVLPLRRANPGKDIFSALLRAKVDGGRSITDEEIAIQGCQLVGAGLDTVVSMLGFITKFLAENPGHRQQLVDDPALINDALEQMMRRFGIVNISRVVVHDIEFNGVKLKAGDLVLTPLTISGLDPRRYADPDTVDFRSKDKKHLAFGRGVHQCIGAYLARTELRVFLREWLLRIPQFEIKPGARIVTRCGKTNALVSLPLVWQVR